ncbi:MAG: DUF6064 family protein [Pseudomonadota bacterium]
MELWFSYSPSDFLLFSADTYWRLFERINADLWPLPLFTIPVLVLLAWWVWRGRRWSLTALCVVLAAALLIVSEAFLAMRYQPINWAVAYLRPLFWVEALGLVAASIRLAQPSGGARRWLGFGFLALAAFYPLIGILAGRLWAQAEVFALAPDPTMIAVLGALMLLRSTLAAIALALIPLLWLAVSALTLHTMEEPVWMLTVGIAVVGAVAVLVRGREN